MKIYPFSYNQPNVQIHWQQFLSAEWSPPYNLQGNNFLVPKIDQETDVNHPT